MKVLQAIVRTVIFVIFQMDSKQISDIYHFLWFLGDKSDTFLETFEKRFNDFLKRSQSIVISIICSIFEAGSIIEITNDWILTDIGLITVLDNVYKINSKFSIKVSNKPLTFDWQEDSNRWFMNLDNMKLSKITVENNWKEQLKEDFITEHFGAFVVDSFIHNDRFIINISKDLLEKDDTFDVWDIDRYCYMIVRKGFTEIYPLMVV